MNATWVAGVAGALCLVMSARVARIGLSSRRVGDAMGLLLAPFTGARDLSVAGAFERVGTSAPAGMVQRWLAGRREIARRVVLAGGRPSSEGLAGRVVVGAMIGGAGCVVAGAIVRPMIVIAPLGLVVGAWAPLVHLGRVASDRQARIDAQVPELVELLVAATEAGLPPPTAFARSADLMPDPLGQEMRRAAAQVELGVPWRTALGEVVARTEAPAFATLAGALSRAHRLGGSVQGSLRAIVGQLRTDRRVRAEELARRAPVKMLFPLVFLILPAFLLLTVGPVLLSTIRSLH